MYVLFPAVLYIYLFINYNTYFASCVLLLLFYILIDRSNEIICVGRYVKRIACGVRALWQYSIGGRWQITRYAICPTDGASLFGQPKVAPIP